MVSTRGGLSSPTPSTYHFVCSFRRTVHEKHSATGERGAQTVQVSSATSHTLRYVIESYRLTFTLRLPGRALARSRRAARTASMSERDARAHHEYPTRTLTGRNLREPSSHRQRCHTQLRRCSTHSPVCKTLRHNPHLPDCYTTSAAPRPHPCDYRAP